MLIIVNLLRRNDAYCWAFGKNTIRRFVCLRNDKKVIIIQNVNKLSLQLKNFP